MRIIEMDTGHIPRKGTTVFKVVLLEEANREIEQAERRGAVDALNSVEFKQLLLQAKVIELERLKDNFILLNKSREEYYNLKFAQMVKLRQDIYGIVDKDQRTIAIKKRIHLSEETHKLSGINKGLKQAIGIIEKRLLELKELK